MFSQATILGCLCADPQAFTLPSGTLKVNLRLASNKKYKAQDGSMQEDTLFITAQVWGRTAEVAMQYLKKGQYVLISGDLKQERFTNQQGQEVDKIVVNATELRLMPKSVNQPATQATATQAETIQVVDLNAPEQPATQATATQAQPTTTQNQQMYAQQQINIEDDEIPF